MDLTVLRLNGAPPKEDLENALARLNKNIRRGDVERVLYDAKVEKIKGELPGRIIDFRREHEDYRESARTALRDFRGHLARISGPGVKPCWLDVAIQKIDAMKLPPGPHRRTKEGRHRQ